MTTIMLDTSAYAAFKRGWAEAVAALRQADGILLSVITLGELWGGFEAGTRRERNRQELEEFLSAPRVRIASVGPDTAERYAAIYAYLRKNGRPIPTNDLWIAASAMEHGAELLTSDSHFENVPHILVRFLAP